MSERDHKLDEIAYQLNEHIVAVKGTLELMDTAVTEDDLHELLLKAIERMDAIQELSNDTFAFLKNCLAKIEEIKK